MRTSLKPAFATAANNGAVALGLPHLFSPSGTSRLFPIFQPGRSFASSSGEVRLKSPRLVGAAVADFGAAADRAFCSPGGVMQAVESSARHALATNLVGGGQSALMFTARLYYVASEIHKWTSLDRFP